MTIRDTQECSGAVTQDVRARLAHLDLDLDETTAGYRIVGYAPDSSDNEYGGDTSPGSPWYDECDSLLAEVQAALPDGWTACWDDDDICIDGPEVEP